MTSSPSSTSVPLAAEIPDTFMASFKSWISSGSKQAEIAERRLLTRLSTFRNPSDPDLTLPHSANARLSQVRLDESRSINTLAILPTTPAQSSTPQSREPPPATVVLHGYGAGLGFYSLNFETLSSWVSKRGLPVYFLDWLGMGRSSRPTFQLTARLTDTNARVEQAEDFFLDSLEEWRSKMGIEKMTLVGHSLGAYLVTAYALRFPRHVHRLVLLSPAGVNAGENSTVPEEELTRTRSSPDGAQKRASERQVASAEHRDANPIKHGQQQEKSHRRESWGRRLFTHAWEAGYSPFGVLRAMGPWAPSLVAKYTTRRFADLDPAHTRDLHHYLVEISLARGSGEYALSHILAPMAHARLPLEYRVAKLPKDLPVTFCYGDHDWMDPEGGIRSVKRLREVGNIASRTVIVPGAGHHVYLDNPDAVNKLLVKELDEATKSWRHAPRQR